MNAPSVARDLVCGMDVKTATAAATTELAGTTYYFCCRGCKTKFDADPQRYLSPSSAPVQPSGQTQPLTVHRSRPAPPPAAPPGTM
jgi:Cu+-exporting ATPase